MPQGAGFQDARGQWQFGELDDAGGLASDLLNLAQSRVSTGFLNDRARLLAIEQAIADTGWQSITFTGWTNIQTAVRKIGRIVFLRGELFGGPVGNVAISTLAATFRPPERLAVVIPDINSGIADGVLNVATDGGLSIQRGNGSTASPGLSLGGVSWVAAS